MCQGSGQHPPPLSPMHRNPPVGRGGWVAGCPPLSVVKVVVGWVLEAQKVQETHASMHACMHVCMHPCMLKQIIKYIVSCFFLL